MIRMVCRATLLSALGLMAASFVLAGVPNATNSTGVVGQKLFLGGQAGGVVDFRCERLITVRDASNNPVQNSVVVINFNSCYGGEIRISNTQPFAGMTVNCGARTVSTVTNSSGVARFRILGASNVASAAAAGVGEGCATVTADGVPLGSYSVATADLNGVGGVAGPDLLQFNAALFNAPSCTPCYRARVNFAGAGPGVIDGPDLLFFNGFLTGGGSATSAAAYCP